MLDNHSNGHSSRSSTSRIPTAKPLREPIALIGIGCRFPGGANDPHSFWRLLHDGVDAVGEVPAERWNKDSFYDPEIGKPGKSHACRGGFIEGIDRFDPQFFGISPREAARMDPQQRLLLETAWEALEDGGQVLERVSGSRTAVFVGISNWEYSFAQIDFRDRGSIDVHTNTGGALSIAVNRISYCFDLRGPSVAVDTACSSALLAVAMACKSIWDENCPLALAGGVNTLLLPDWFVGFSRLGMLSPDGHCHAFDAAANGFVRGEGAGFIVLKPLAQALADGDRIYALIRGTAVNQDGRTPGLTVPRQEAQEALLRRAYREAGVSPAQVHYIEAHGTGTPIGDPIEARALGKVLSAGRSEDRPCLIGSVKTNIGHLEAGSGIAGIIKTALALHHRRIPANLHFINPNPAIDFAQLRLRVPVRCEDWPIADEPATAGVNSFGYGGTNAHIVLQEVASGERLVASEKEKSSSSLSANHSPLATLPYLLPLSARSPQALREMANVWRQFLETCSDDVSLLDLAGNAALRRSHHEDRLALVAHSRQELAEQLMAFSAGQSAPDVFSGRVADKQDPRLAFVCSGQGPQWWAMGRQLLEQEPVFRGEIERCDAIVRRLGSWSLLEELTADESASRMDVTAISQPAIFALQVALAALWRSWGVRPQWLVGHSVGEVAAAHLAGVFDLQDAMRVIYQRGRCMELAPSRGRMLAAGISAEEARELLRPYGARASLAAVNSAASVTLSGEYEPLERIAHVLEERRVFWRFLQVHYAFHSAQMVPIRHELLASLRGLQPRSAKLPLFSTVLGRRIDGQEMGPEYWWRNVRQTVRFADGVNHLVNSGCDTVVELSPHPVLAVAVAECYRQRGKSVQVLPSLRRREEERTTLLRSLGQLYTLGQTIDWAGAAPSAARFVRLPLYPWQHERFWSESAESRRTRLAPRGHPLLGVSLAAPQPSWQTRLDLRLLPYLADHRVQQGIIVPASAFVETALAAAREVFGDRPCRLEDIKLTNPCLPNYDKPLRLFTLFNNVDSTVRVFGRAVDGEEDWTIHSSAVVRSQLDGAAEETLTLEEIRRRCPQPFSRAQCYDAFRKIGLDYGPMFQGIESGWRGECEAITSVRLPADADNADNDYLLHPALLDACFQGIAPANKDFNDEYSGLYLPVDIEEVQFYRRPGRNVWCHVRLRESSERWSVGDLDIFDEEGRLSALIRGFRCQRMGGGTEAMLEEMLYAYEWRSGTGVSPVCAGGTGVSPLCAGPTKEPESWLILADRGGVGERLAEKLRANGDDCTLVFADEKRDSVHFPEKQNVPFFIVHLGSLDARTSDKMDTASLEASQETGLLNALHLVQNWEKINAERTARLFLVTRGAQAVGGESEPLAVAQCSLVGLGRVIASEYPRLRCRLVDLDPGDNDDISSLFNEFKTNDDEDEIALRGGKRYVHRYVPSTGAADSEQTAQDVPYRWTVARAGNLDELKPRELRQKAPAPGHVEIEVVAAGLNFSDVLKALGLYPGLGDGPLPLGAECSGRIAAVGEGVHDLHVGDEVVAVAPFAFASHVTTRAELAALKPPRLSFEEAATLPIAFLTASYALNHLGRLADGERVLIHSATGGVGLAAVQCARRAGAEIFATAGTPEKREYLKNMGIAHVMDSRSLAFADEVRRATGGRGVDAVLNSLAGEGLLRGLDCLSDYGRFLEIGKRDIYGNSRLGLRPFRKNLSFFAIDLDRMMRERPAVLGSLLRQIVREVGDGRLAPLPHRVYAMADAVAAFRFMQQSKHIGKIVLSTRQLTADSQNTNETPFAVAPAEEAIAFRADATYLIAGGLGGFGLATARWMVERGARHLALLGRRGVHSPEVSQKISEIEKLGARVVVHRADVAVEADVAAVMAAIERDGPPLRGVLHAAMVLEDGLLLNLDDEKMRRVLAPKLSGAWNLHRQTLKCPLDFFVLYSSVASVLGHAGQGNYAAANAFLDGLAWYRRALGLPALAVNWGHLGEVGYLAERPQLSERLERQGVRSFPIRQALTALERLLQRRAVQSTVMRVDWSRWHGSGVSGQASPRFVDLLEQHKNGAAGDGPRRLSSAEAIRAAAQETRRTMLATMLRDKVARVLGTSADRLDEEKALLNLGLDSLMAVELRNWIEQELRVNLPIMELMRCPGLSPLTDVLLAQLSNEEAVASTEDRDEAPAASTSTDDLLEQLDDMPGEDVDALLATLLTDESRERSVTP